MTVPLLEYPSCSSPGNATMSTTYKNIYISNHATKFNNMITRHLKLLCAILIIKIEALRGLPSFCFEPIVFLS